MGNYPDTELEDVERYFEFDKTSIAKPDGSKFVAAYRFYNRLKIYDAEGEMLKAVQINDPFLPIEAREDHFRYRNLAWATDSYFYSVGIYSLREKYEERLESFQTSLEIWDWDGRPVYRAMLDRAVFRFTVSEKHGKLYAYSALGTQEIFEYELPEILNFY